MGKIAHKKVFITASVPTQCEYASSPQYAGGLNRVLAENGIPPVKSCLELFSWADRKFVPSCYELEPFEGKDVVFCGAWKHAAPVCPQPRNKILVYMGNGTISQRKMLKEILSAFSDSNDSVYIAGTGLERKTFSNIQIAPHFDFQALLPQALLFIHHGGQNSMVDGFIYGVPQLICPGKVFERKYNTNSIVKAGAGIELPYQKFTGKQIKAAFQEIISSPRYQENAVKLGAVLTSMGGTNKIIEELLLCRAGSV